MFAPADRWPAGVLHTWTQRLPALMRELGGPTAHRRATTDEYFSSEKLEERLAAAASE